MTIIEAEKQYLWEKENCRQQFTEHMKRAILIWNTISAVLIITGIVLSIIGFNTPPEIDSTGFEWTPTAALFEKYFGVGSICLGVFFIIFINISLRSAIRTGPKNFLPQIKNLYLNYLKCEDMSKNDKEFYKQKLEDIRNMELVNAINSAAATASAAIIFSALNK